MQEILERLVAARIQLLPLTQIERHWVFERDGFVSLVERTRDDRFGCIGSAGLLTGQGMAVLIQRGEEHFFVAKGFEQPATAEQVARLREFARELRDAIELR